MRPFLLALCASALAMLPTRAADDPAFDDAPLHAVQFVDREEGWAVGDDGVVLHTIDGGKSWERQPTGVRASLRSLHFLTPYTGWVAGREELPHGSGSGGVLLFTKDGGIKWHRVTLNALPGLNKVRFFEDGKTGFVAGDGCDQYPTGLFLTTDAGLTWKPVAGPRCSTWLAADWIDEKTGALAGAWNRLGVYRGGKIGLADIDTLGGRNLRGMHLLGKQGIAVGQGGLVLVSDDISQGTWAYADLRLPTEVRAAWDFHAVSAVGDEIWVAGRPGSAVLHSADRGAKWEVQRTGMPVPINGLFFSDEKHGWAVGELGTVLGTTDGGKTWKAQRKGGERSAALLIHSRMSNLPIDTVSLLGAEEGYLVNAVRVYASDPASASLERAPEEMRHATAIRAAGGAGGETLWQFPIPLHLARSDKAGLVKEWDKRHDGRAAEEMLRQMVLAIRTWRPAVIITDNPDPKTSGSPSESLLAEALHEAFTRAADPQVFPEQIDKLGLAPWQASKVYGQWPGPSEANVSLDLTEPGRRMASSARDYASEATSMLWDSPGLLPRLRHYRLLEAKVEGAANQKYLMDGVILAPGGPARRLLGEAPELTAEVKKAVAAKRNLLAMAEAPDNAITDPAKLLALIGPSLKELSYDQAAPAALAIANQYARLGQWPMAREAYLLMVDRYPSHPLAADAYRWLIRHNSSSEARRRHELGQFRVVTTTEFSTTSKPKEQSSVVPAAGKMAPVEDDVDVIIKQTRELSMLSNAAETRKWYQGALEVEPRLAGFGPLFEREPAMQFCLQSARRSLGEFEAARKWYTQFAANRVAGPWKDAALAEMWLVQRSGPPPKPVLTCREVGDKPFLDGKLDDDCWTRHQPAKLKNAVGETVKDNPTEVWLAYDKDFMYVAVRCKHPEGEKVPLVKVRPRDADVRPFDRVEIMLDLDRDYSTYFRLQIDQRGCVCEDCWGDLSWNPRWFVTAESDGAGWTAEAAIPLVELTGDSITTGRAWAANVVRVLPGRGVQAFSTPADVLPRPEGMGVLLFSGEQKMKNDVQAPAEMNKVR